MEFRRKPPQTRIPQLIKRSISIQLKMSGAFPPSGLESIGESVELKSKRKNPERTRFDDPDSHNEFTAQYTELLGNKHISHRPEIFE